MDFIYKAILTAALNLSINNTQLCSRQIEMQRLGSTYTSHAQYVSHMSSHIHSSGSSPGSPQI